ncbi:RluA family pseudouridine synthase [Candidatus Neptunochlamydia vexilliferae]|uniref:RluA family pseudouridine synthase n=1 Tax=Candidatus Neptunichlamydia vexilliferae TaxID=1651774 RepID=UPI00189188D7|nr:RluA family pseudouridine synthase [Candidatus Neptunochlamydia vexilliferae]
MSKVLFSAIFLPMEGKQLLLERLVLEFPESSRSTLRKWVKNGRIFVDGKKIKLPNETIGEGATITLKEKQKFLDLDIEVLYEDRDLVVVNKPEGVLSVAAAFDSENTVHGVMKKHYRRAFPVHRLDRETSGVMVMALTEEAWEKLKEQFHAHSIHRQYRAIVRGRLEGEGTWKCRLKEDQNYFVRPHPKGDMAITHYKVLETRGKTTAIEFTLETGKKNQIRAQALAATFPILGDQKYGDTGSHRLHLHACCLAFTHPITGKSMHFESPVPF